MRVKIDSYYTFKRSNGTPGFCRVIGRTGDRVQMIPLVLSLDGGWNRFPLLQCTCLVEEVEENVRMSSIFVFDNKFCASGGFAPTFGMSGMYHILQCNAHEFDNVAYIRSDVSSTKVIFFV